MCAAKYAVDTSVAIAALDAAHAAHQTCRSAVLQHRPALAGHAAFETLAVLTRMPAPANVDVKDAAYLIDKVFPEILFLDGAATAELFARLPVLGVTGGAVYDALVAEAARAHGAALLTRDRRALGTYEVIGVRPVFVGV